MNEFHSVADAIFSQIGRPAFAMLGSNRFLKFPDALKFNIRGCRKINTIVVTLDAGTDLYKVDFWQMFPSGKTTLIASHPNVFCGDLHGIIESETGLYTSLGVTA